jgi:hypothetical protein
MDIQENIKEMSLLFLTALIFSITINFLNKSFYVETAIIFFIILGINLLAKKAIGYYFEAKVTEKYWTWHKFGLKKNEKFKRPLVMVWLPLVLSILTKGMFWWLAVFETEISPKTERVAKRHGLYRFSQITEWHYALIATTGIIACWLMAFVGYLLGFENFAQFSIIYAFWNLIPLSRWDGARILWGSKILWLVLFLLEVILFGYSLAIV